MASDLSVQLVTFNFASPTFAYNFLAEEWNISHRAAKVRPEFMEEIATEFILFDELIPALQKFFDSLG